MNKKVTFLYHSGFVVELEQHVLIFDYYKGELPSFDKTKKVLVFASHFHEDHFNREIFSWKKSFAHIRFILSREIRVPREEQDDTILKIRRRETMETDDCVIRSLRSTDAGVAFLVKCEGQTIYHAGDLNWWHWEEEDKNYNNQMRINYQNEIEQLKDETIDLAFLVLDPRQDEEYFWGFDWFMRHTDTRQAVPMHMWEDYGIVDKLLEADAAGAYKERVIKIKEENQQFCC